MSEYDYLEFKHLQAIVAVADAGTFTAVAAGSGNRGRALAGLASLYAARSAGGTHRSDRWIRRRVSSSSIGTATPKSKQQRNTQKRYIDEMKAFVR